MLFLNKFLPIFVLPIGVVILLVLLAGLKKWRWAAFTAAAVLLVASLPAVGSWLVGRLEGVYPAIKIAEVPKSDAVLVLGGIVGVVPESGYLPNWADSMERFEGGVVLLQTERAPLLLFTGAGTKESKLSEGAILRARALARGIPADAVDVTGHVANTADEARQTAAYCQEKGIKRLILVTSAWHMPRAMRQFRKAGVEIVPFPVDYRYDRVYGFDWLDFIPTASGLMLTELALRECYGMAFYALAGR